MPKIAFIHPDLGIGGAERLVVDAAVGLQEIGNEVEIYTSHCDKTHCFEEVSSGKLKVLVCGDFLPTSFFGALSILCAIFRQLYLTFVLISSLRVLEYDFFIVDQLSVCVPLLRIFGRRDSRVLFYCHFPDQLLSKKGGLLKKLYRLPFDALEEYTTGVSDRVVVNSTFTKSIFYETFPNLSKLDPKVIYPCVDISQATADNSVGEAELDEFMNGSPFLLSVNRFERLKNIGLAIEAYSELRKQLLDAAECPKLVIAGGFDSRVRENVEYLEELRKLCDKLGLIHYTFRGKLVMKPKSTDVIFLPSVRTSIKNAALRKTTLLLYTPTFEHFGIVPVEAMLQKTPVVAINRGGPLETVVHFDGLNIDTATGFNKPNDVTAWAETLREYQNMENDAKAALKENGYNWVVSKFSRESMSEDFLTNLQEATQEPRKALVSATSTTTMMIFGLLGVALALRFA